MVRGARVRRSVPPRGAAPTVSAVLPLRERGAVCPRPAVLRAALTVLDGQGVFLGSTPGAPLAILLFRLRPGSRQIRDDQVPQ